MTGLAGLRIALVGPLPPPSGGMANQMLALAENLRRDCAVVDMVQSNAPYHPRWIASVPMVRAAFRLLPYVFALRRAVRRSQVLHVLANSGWSWHLCTAPAIWVSWTYGVPVIVHYHGGEASTFLAGAIKWVRWSMARVAELVVPSGYLVEVFHAFGMHARAIPNLIDLDRFVQPSRTASNSPHIVVARNLEPVYDTGTAIHAFARLLVRWPDARLTIAGTGPERARLQELVRELGVEARVRFAGRLDRDGVVEMFKSADLSLNPSRVDNMPVSLLEAMASGVPVVSTNVGGIPYVVRDGHTALLVGPGDASAMADAAERLLSDAELRTRIVHAARQAVQDYSWPHASGEWLSVYRSALATRSPSSVAVR